MKLLKTFLNYLKNLRKPKKIREYHYKVQIDLLIYDKQATRFKIPTIREYVLSEQEETYMPISLKMVVIDDMDYRINRNSYSFDQDKKVVTIFRDNISRYELDYQILEKKLV